MFIEHLKPKKRNVSAMINKIVNSLFILLFAFLLTLAVLSTISIIEARTTWNSPTYGSSGN